MSKATAAKEWAKLGAGEQAQAQAGVPGFIAFCREDRTYRPVHAVRYLSERRFEGFAPAKAESAGTDSDPLIDFPGGYKRRESFVVEAIEKFRRDPRSWPESILGSPPTSPSCAVPSRLLSEAEFA